MTPKSIVQSKESVAYSHSNQDPEAHFCRPNIDALTIFCGMRLKLPHLQFILQEAKILIVIYFKNYNSVEQMLQWTTQFLYVSTHKDTHVHSGCGERERGCI